MTLQQIIEQLGVGGGLSIIIIMMGLIEVTPIKISPLNWIGKRVNQSTIERIDEIEKSIKKVDSKLDEHVAESYRNNIFCVQDRLIKGDKFTREKWKKAIKSCQAYEKYVEDNELSNDLADEAMDYIHRQYQKSLDTADFLDIPHMKG